MAGVSAVDFTTRDGRHVRIGPPEPEALISAVAARLPLGAATGPRDVGPGARSSWAFVPPAIVATAVVVVLGLARTGERPIEASVGASEFVVKGAGYSTRVPLDQIRGVSLVDELPAIERKVNGFAAGGKLRGKFTVAGIGPSEVFVDRDVPPFVVVKTTNGVLIVNGVNADATRRLCDDLARAAGR